SGPWPVSGPTCREPAVADAGADGRAAHRSAGAEGGHEGRAGRPPAPDARCSAGRRRHAGMRKAEPPQGPSLRRTSRPLLLVAALVTSLAKHLAVLLLRHALAALLDDGTHADLTDVDDGCRRKRRRAAHQRYSLPGASARVRGGPLQRQTLRQHLLHRGLRHAEGLAHPDRGQVAGVHHPVHGHPGDPRHLGDLRDREEARCARLGHARLSSRLTTPTGARRRPALPARRATLEAPRTETVTIRGTHTCCGSRPCSGNTARLVASTARSTGSPGRCPACLRRKWAGRPSVLAAGRASPSSSGSCASQDSGTGAVGSIGRAATTAARGVHARGTVETTS